MPRVGRTDVFEREYTQRFRAMLSPVGEFVTYERDRAARDIGVHITRRTPSGAEHLTSALCWFQLKGVMASTLTADSFQAADVIKLPLDVQHLKFWYLQPTSTYLVVYVESAGVFLILNLVRYMEERWGAKIFQLRQSQVTIDVPCGSVLDDQALALILRESTVQEWTKALSGDGDAAVHCVRDYGLIWRLGSAEERRVEHHVEVWDWQSKTRGEIRFLERSPGAEEWSCIRLHWQFMLKGKDLEATYPYLDFRPLEDDSPWFDEEDFGVPPIELSSGDEIPGTDASGEYYVYTMGVRLNELGRRLFQSVLQLREIGFIDIDEEESELVSVAPWHYRSV